MKRKSIFLVAAAAVLLLAGASFAGDISGVKHVDNLNIDIWLNKAEGSTYYYGEDVAIYFQTNQDCYVVVYDIDPAGNVSMLFPADYESSCFVRAGEQYRIPDIYDDYRLEITGPSGPEHIYAVATPKPITPPDFIKYEFFDYGDWDYYYDDFIHSVRGEREAFARDLNQRIVNGPFVSTSIMFNIDENYRNHRWYRHWDYDPYYVGSVWIGADYPGCEIWIDGVYYGIAPLLVPEIYIGRHWVWIYYHGYPCWQDYVYIRGGQRYYVDAKIKRGRLNPSDGHKYLRDWRFKYEKYPNEPDFKHKADTDRAKYSRPKLQPPASVIDKYTKRSASRDNIAAKEKENQTSRPVIKSSKSPQTERKAIQRRYDKTDNNDGNNDLKIQPRQPIIKDEPKMQRQEETKKEISKSSSGSSGAIQKKSSGSSSDTDEKKSSGSNSGTVHKKSSGSSGSSSVHRSSSGSKSSGGQRSSGKSSGSGGDKESKRGRK